MKFIQMRALPRQCDFSAGSRRELTGLRIQHRCGLSHEDESWAMRTLILRQEVPRLTEIDSCTWESESVKRVSTSLWYLRHFHGVCAPNTRSPGRLYGLVWKQNKVGAKAATKYYLQKPAKYASLAGSFDMAPIIQYAVVCHMESRRPQKMYKKRWPA